MAVVRRVLTPVSQSAANPELEERWSDIARLKPLLRNHVTVIAQRYRGQQWYVLHDTLNGRHTRINAVAHGFLARLDGRLSIAEVLSELERVGDTPLTRDDALGLLAQLQQQGGMLKGVDIDARLLAMNTKARPQNSLLRKLTMPLAIRVPLLDPDRLLDKLGPCSFPLYGRVAGICWFVILCLALVTAAAQWSELKSEFSHLMGSPHYLLLMWLVYPMLKVFHEFSHAIMVKRGGGEVHEMGITFLVFTPVPYVDASAAWSFRSRWQRVMVSAVGIMAELLIASLALFFWVYSESGFARDLAFAIVLVGSFSTVAFNANPLLKFDGYYMLQDWLEIPNLYQRAQRYLLYLIKRYILGVAAAPSPVLAKGESRWFFVFGVCSLLYRNLVMLLIALWLVGKLLLLGIVILAWVFVQQYLLPLIKAVHYLSVSEDLTGRRVSRVSVLAGFTFIALVALFFVPVSYSSRVQGIVWVSDQAQLYASNAGEVVEVIAQPGQFIDKGEPVLRLAQPELAARIEVLQSRLAAYQIRRFAEVADTEVRSSLTQDDIAATQAELDQALDQQRSLLVKAQAAGTFAVADSGQLPGRYFAQGALIGHIVGPQQLVIKVVVPEHRMGALSRGIESASVRMAEHFARPVPAFLSRETPSADNRLPSAALGTAAGGGIAIAPGDNTGMKTRERVFHLELVLAEPAEIAGVGERAYVSLQHQSTPLADRFLRSTRQLFLKHLPEYAG